MSTFKKLTKQHGMAKERRVNALRFFAEQTKLPGAPGVIAAVLHQRLSRIHKSSRLNGVEKDDAFRSIIQSGRNPRTTAAGGAASPEAAPGPTGELEPGVAG